MCKKMVISQQHMLKLFQQLATHVKVVSDELRLLCGKRVIAVGSAQSRHKTSFHKVKIQ